MKPAGDADHDCQDPRGEVLIAESEVPVKFKDKEHCEVARGRWTCPYTGETVSDPTLLDIDHMVPLENANRSVGWRWAPEKKEAYANDLDEPEHLVAVIKSANRSKGSKGPESWLPSNAGFRCAYVANWVARSGGDWFRVAPSTRPSKRSSLRAHDRR